ncbi:hypothetical protein M8C21_032885 [Ambrosia artemisiifolia]|uniref:Uncharacterized protein n=1 Tax=Ambrosia artemisiifolia TaxID=4212 RepID=A0AAD5CD21_AMBAR|nr:hypothetical protein M8C21_032885 [Ambrosia artemisiifolia]
MRLLFLMYGLFEV